MQTLRHYFVALDPCRTAVHRTECHDAAMRAVVNYHAAVYGIFLPRPTELGHAEDLVLRQTRYRGVYAI